MTLNVLSAAGSTANKGANTPLGLFFHLASGSHRPAGAVEFLDIAKPTAPMRQI